MFHVMVRSFEGSRFTKDTEGMRWERREVWSTFVTEEYYTIAILTKLTLLNSGVTADVVPDHQYKQWCQHHKVA